MYLKILNKDFDNHQLKVFAAFSAIYIIWGSTYLAMRYMVETIPPLLSVGIRFTIAGLILSVWFYLRTKKKPGPEDLKGAAVLGVLMIFIGYSTLAWAQQFIPSGLAASVVASISIWMVLLDWKIFGNKKPDKVTVTGLLMGIIGVALLTILKEDVLINKNISGGSVLVGVGIITLATFVWAYGSLYSRKIKNTIPLSFLVGLQMIFGGILLIVVGSILGEWSSFNMSRISFLSIGSLLYLILAGTVIAHSAFYWLLRVKSPALVGTYAFFNPTIALLLGVLLAGEMLTPVMILGAGLILSSIFIIKKTSFRLKNFKSIFNGNGLLNNHNKKVLEVK
jgi:drug/metabolite transporter (DMT)-like permease